MYSVSNGGSLRIRMTSYSPSLGSKSGAALKPSSRIVENLERRDPAPGDAVAQRQIAELGVEDLPTARLRGEQDARVVSLAGLMDSIGSITTIARTADDMLEPPGTPLASIQGGAV